MKTKVLILLLLAPSLTFSQTENAIYLGSSLSLGNNIGGDLDLNFIHKNKYSLSTGVKAHLTINDDIPDDYYKGFDYLLNNIETMGTYYILLGRVFNNNDKTRFNLQAGIGFSTQFTQANFVRKEAASEEGYYIYDYDQIKNRATSLMIKPKIEITAPKIIGLYLYGEFITNRYEKYYGIGIGLMLGKVR